jgi:hypothetical protein
MAVEPYTIFVPNEALEELRQRLSLAKFPDQLEGPDPWAFGTPSSEVERLVGAWREKFDWRKAEAELNQLPQFKASVAVGGFGSLEIHCEDSQVGQQFSNGADDCR